MGGGGGGVDDNTAQGGHLIAATLTSRSGKGPGSDLPDGSVVAVGEVGAGAVSTLRGQGMRDLTAEGADASEDGTGRGTPIVAQTLKESTRYPSHEATTPIEGTNVRRLTPLECERLQGYPDNWTATSNGKPQADAPRYRQLGNSIAVPVFEWVARRIAAHEAHNTIDT
jgi:site-specific DNA-cytosine methylase